MDGDIEATMQNTHSSNGQRQSGQDRNGQHRNGQAQHDNRPTLITGGAGFVGTNLAHRLLSQGQRVLVFDNLSRAGVERNLRWLRETHGDLLQVEIADVRDVRAVQRAVERSSSVFHFAAQVAVTTSLIAPIEDFEINARGTLNVLEANRVLDAPIPLVFTSTNKVYGGLDDVALSLQNNRYEPADNHLRAHGISEARALDFHSPYGCSKGCADQYVLDYARTFDIPTVVLRMSCIYGPHQCGNEDQGWVAHFLLRALESEPITLFGDGKQVRDALFVDDLVDAFLTARQQIDQLSGQAFNIGGGAHNTTSLLQLIEAIGELHVQSPQVEFSDWRVGDQRYYVSDVAKFASATGWKPRVDVQSGVAHLYRWLRENVRENAVA
jgi:CDP-paratose 2-epimerase